MPYPPPVAPGEADLRAYATAVRTLLAHGGYERTGDTAQARRWDIAHVVALLDQLGRPDRRHTVHVAGSKGKGSTATLTEAILRAAGAHTLLLTSPDLHAARERVAIDGAPIAHAAFAAAAEQLLALPETAGWSYFELLTVLGWIAGAAAGCDWQVLEVGLGGRLDTTNAVASKEVAVITPIDLEHTAILGDTIRAIATEKAGIITGPCEVVTAPMRASALDAVRARASECGATVHAVPDECALHPRAHDLHGQQFDLRTPLRTYRALRMSLVGPHQAENAATAVRAAELAWAATGAELPEHAVRAGIEDARMPGRFEVVREHPLVIVDGLHTPLAARRFRQTVETVQPARPHVFVLGLLGGKDAAGVAEALLAPGDTVIVTAPLTPRAADPDAVARACIAAGADVHRAPSVPAAIEAARALAGERGTVLVTGSLYTVAEAREHLLPIAGDRALGLR